MTPEDFRDFVAGAIGIVLSDQELITLLRNCSVPDTADIDVAALMEAMKAGAAGGVPRRGSEDQTEQKSKQNRTT